MGCFRILCVLLALWLEASNAAMIPRPPLSEYHSRIEEALGNPSPSVEQGGVKRIGRTFYPAGYGADPTGAQESSAAILSAIQDAFRVQKGLELISGINDLGGVVIDLQGGNYKISRPIRLPAGGGNAVIHSGTLRASADFPADQYLIELSSSPPGRRLHLGKFFEENEFEETKPTNDPINYEAITLRDLLLDSNFRGGGLLVAYSLRTRIDTCFFIHFSTTGVLVKKGHETFISNSFLGQIPTAGGDRRERNFSGTAIDLDSNDNVLTDIAIFSAATGIILRGPANMVTGVHCYNKATYFGGIGILVKSVGSGLTRIDNCYMDFTAIVIDDPVQVHVTNALFLGNANVVLKSVEGKISGLNIVDCMFSGDKGTPIVKLDESGGPFTSIDQVVVDRNNVVGMALKTTVAKKTIASKGTRWVADFSQELVFPSRITHFQYSFYTKRMVKFPASAVTAVSNNSLVVETSKEVDGVVSVVVDQNAMPGENILFI